MSHYRLVLREIWSIFTLVQPWPRVKTEKKTLKLLCFRPRVKELNNIYPLINEIRNTKQAHNGPKNNSKARHHDFPRHVKTKQHYNSNI